MKPSMTRWTISPSKNGVGLLRLERRRGASRSPRRRDERAISAHYDVGNDFYWLVLGPSMAYSCAYFEQAPSTAYTLEDAQRATVDIVARKLGLQPGLRVLDVGCGWGGFVVHAAREKGVRAVGVTPSTASSSSTAASPEASATARTIGSGCSSSAGDYCRDPTLMGEEPVKDAGDQLQRDMMEPPALSAIR